jgi:hypothetical protein
MNNPWKLATLGLALVSVTALSTGLTTAYMLRPAALAEATAPVPVTPETLTSTPAARAVPARVVAPRAVARPAAVVQPAVARQPVAAPQPAVATQPAVVRPVAVQTDATDCSTGGQRAMKIAKPGIIGALAGAGLGAVGGAIADGGTAAGKGALIGGLAGAALGGGYGAYKTKQECGTIFGGSSGFAGDARRSAASPVAPEAALGASSSGITVYNAR